jgi:hypothetical protein
MFILDAVLSSLFLVQMVSDFNVLYEKPEYYKEIH